MMAYFPNGSAGAILDSQCGECIYAHDNDVLCPVQAVQMTFNYDQCNKGQEKLKAAMTMLVADDGTCKMREAMQTSKISCVSISDFVDNDFIRAFARQFNTSFIDARERAEWVANRITRRAMEEIE